MTRASMFFLILVLAAAMILPGCGKKDTVEIQEIEPAEAAQDRPHEPSRRVRFPEVGREGLGTGAESAERRDGLRGGGRIAPEVDGDVESRARGALGKGTSQAVGGSGDESDGSHARSVSPAVLSLRRIYNAASRS